MRIGLFTLRYGRDANASTACGGGQEEREGEDEADVKVVPATSTVILLLCSPFVYKPQSSYKGSIKKLPN